MASKNQHDDHDHESEWGLCKACKWWQLEPDGKVGDQALGLCIDEDLLTYNLRVSGLSGCNHFMQGEPARAEGSAEAPPRAKAMR